MSYGMGGASLVSMGKRIGLGGNASAQAATSSAKEVNGYRSFAEALEGQLTSLQSTRGFLGFALFFR